MLDECEKYNNQIEQANTHERKRQISAKFLRRMTNCKLKGIVTDEMHDNSFIIKNDSLKIAINLYFENKKIKNEILQEVLKATKEKRTELTRLKEENKYKERHLERLIKENTWKEEELKEYEEKKNLLDNINERDFENRTMVFKELSKVKISFEKNLLNEIAKSVDNYDISEEKNLGYLIGLRKCKKTILEELNVKINSYDQSNSSVRMFYNEKEDKVDVATIL